MLTPQPLGPLSDMQVTIAAGASLSNVLTPAPAGANMVRIIMPQQWTAANLTFQVSTDGVTFYDLFDHNGAEIAVTVQAGVAIAVMQATAWSPMFNSIIFRSGSRTHPIAQNAARTFTVSFR